MLPGSSDRPNDLLKSTALLVLSCLTFGRTGYQRQSTRMNTLTLCLLT
jgi:hypothetical protein